MFEKEAKEWFRNSSYYETCPACKESFESTAENIFQESAEFGYNKAEEESRDIIKGLIDTLEVIDGEQTKELKPVKQAEEFLCQHNKKFR